MLGFFEGVQGCLFFNAIVNVRPLDCVPGFGLVETGKSF